MTRRDYAVARVLALRWNTSELCRMQAVAVRERDYSAVARDDVAIAIRAIDGGGST